MKPIIQKLWVCIGVLCTSLSASASDFTSDDLCYNILSEKDRTVEVTYYFWGSGNEYYVSGDIEIPRKVIYNSKTYTVTTIGAGAFSHCKMLTSVAIPNSVTTIGEKAFSYCKMLPSVTIPPSVTTIGKEAFKSCYSLENINVDSENANYSSIDGILYNKDVTSLMCCPCTKSNVTIPTSVTTIGNYAFDDCRSLTSVTIPPSVTSIGEHAFRSCSSLTSVTIPPSVTTIGKEAFYCRDLKSVYVQWENPLECYTPFLDKSFKEAVLYVPVGTKAKYEKVDPWRNFWNIEEKVYNAVHGIEVDEYCAPHISVNNGVLTIVGIASLESVTVYDMQGRIVYNGISHTIDNLSSGVYIVKVGNQTIKITI